MVVSIENFARKNRYIFDSDEKIGTNGRICKLENTMKYVHFTMFRLA